MTGLITLLVIQIVLPILYLSGAELFYGFLLLVFVIMLVIWIWKLVISLVVGG